MNVDFSQVQWHTSEVVIDSKPHQRACAEICGKNVCIVKQEGSKWVSVWVGEDAEVVRENNLRRWILKHLGQSFDE